MRISYNNIGPRCEIQKIIIFDAENSLIYGKMPHSPCRLESYLQAKKYPAVQRPAKCNFFAWKIRRVQPLKHSQQLTSTERVMAWDKGFRASVYGIISGKPSEHTLIVGGETFRRLRNLQRNVKCECDTDFRIGCKLRVH